MKFRCPYCKHEIGGEPVATCPRCHKTFNIPVKYVKRKKSDRERAKERIARDADRQRKAMGVTIPVVGRGPTTVISLLFIMIVAGGMLLSRLFSTVRPKGVARKVSVAESQMTTLRIALELYRRDCGQFPSTNQGTIALLNKPGTDGLLCNYVHKVPKVDPWGTPYVYTPGTTNDFLLTSCGPDGELGTEDDVLPDMIEVTNKLNHAAGYVETAPKWEPEDSDPVPDGQVRVNVIK